MKIWTFWANLRRERRHGTVTARAKWLGVLKPATADANRKSGNVNVKKGPGTIDKDAEREKKELQTVYEIPNAETCQNAPYN